MRFPRSTEATDREVIVEGVLVDTADVLHHLVDGDSTLVQDQLLRDVSDGLRDISQECSCLRPGERHRIAVRLLTAPDDVDGRQCLLALIEDEVQVCACSLSEEEERRCVI